MKNGNKFFVIATLVFIIGLFSGGIVCALYARSWNEKKNHQATEYMLSGDYETALLLFEEIKDFHGVDAKIRECEQKLGYELCPECGYVLNKGDEK